MKAALILVALSVACTFDPGRGFSTLDSVELQAAFEPGERELDGGVLTDLGYVVRLSAIRLELFELELATFEDEALEAPDALEHCHEAECETESEESEPHEEPAADGVAVATLPVDRGVDVLAGESVLLTRVDPSPELPELRLERAELHLGRIELTGVVAAGDLATEIPLSVSLDLDTHVAAEMDVAVDHESPEHLSLHGTLVLEGPPFDGIDFGASDSFVLDDDDERAEALRSALAAALHLSLEAEGHE